MILAPWAAPTARAFTHPGFTLSPADLDEVKSKLTTQPWKTGYDALAADSKSKTTYTMQGPFASVSRTPNVTVRIRPCPAGISFARGAIPTPRATIRVS